MRNRLIKLIMECSTFTPQYAKQARLHAKYVADHLLANSVIVPPCKVLDMVYYLTSTETEKTLNASDIFFGVVQAISFDGKEIWVAAKYTNGLFYYHKASDFGKTVFLTPMEAEKALAARI